MRIVSEALVAQDGLLIIKPHEKPAAIYEHDWDFADAIVQLKWS